jgi:methionyl-tRNA formyltransferase
MGKPMRVVFMGTPDFAAVILPQIVLSDCEVVAVYSQPPRPAGRGKLLRKSPVHQVAEAHGLPVYTPVSLKEQAAQDMFKAHKADVAVVVAYGLLLPPAILAAPKFGCLNIHASLLPRWRGAAPIQRAILAGDTKTGITFMQMDAGLDTGPILKQIPVAIQPNWHAERLTGVLCSLAAEHIAETLAELPLPATPQPEEGVTYAAKISPAEAKLDWKTSATLLERAVRAFAPVPGAWCLLPDGERLKVLRAEMVPGSGVPGTLLDDQLTVACGSGALHLTLVQKAGKKPMAADEFQRGVKLAQGGVLS